LANLSNIGHAKPGLAAIRVKIRIDAVLAWAEQLRGGGLALEKRFAETLGQVSHLFERPDEVAESGFLASVDEFDVMNRDSHISVS